MELRHLRYFVAVAEHGGFSRAAAKLLVSQPPLSAQIRALEEELGAPLFKRMPRGVRLTPAGEAYLVEARAILERVESAAQRVREAESARCATVRLALVPSSTLSLLPALIARIAADGLDVRLQVREMITSAQVTALGAGLLDVGIARPAGQAPDKFEHTAIDDPYCIALPPAHAAAAGSAPVALKAFARDAFVSFARFQDPAYFDRTLALCAAAGFSPELRHEAGQFSNVLAMVSCGLGVAIVPASVATVSPAPVAVRRLRGPQQASRLAVFAADREGSGTPAAHVARMAGEELQRLAAQAHHNAS